MCCSLFFVCVRYTKGLSIEVNVSKSATHGHVAFAQVFNMVPPTQLPQCPTLLFPSILPPLLPSPLEPTLMNLSMKVLSLSTSCMIQITSLVKPTSHPQAVPTSMAVTARGCCLNKVYLINSGSVSSKLGTSSRHTLMCDHDRHDVDLSRHACQPAALPI